MGKKDNPKDGKIELVDQSPGEVKIAGTPRKRKPRPRRSNVEQRTLPGLPTDQRGQRGIANRKR